MTKGASQNELEVGRGSTDRLTARTNLARLKRRIYRIGLVMVMLSILYSVWLLLTGRTSYPSATPYLVTDVVIVGACLFALVALRDLKNVRLVEIGLCTAALFYQGYWDVVSLLSGELPRPEYQMTSTATFLLGAAFLCLAVPRRHLPLALALTFGTHELLTWATLLRFPWQGLHSAQLMNDLTMLVTMLCLSLLGAYQHVTLLAQQEAEMMQRLANTDSLTGLANRRFMYSELQSFQPGAVLLFDLDDFKALNDTHGHAAGDAALVRVAGVLRELLGPAGHVGRWGGEEFIVLLRGVTPEQARSMAEEIRARIEQVGRMDALPLSASIGLAFTEPGEGPMDTLKRADDRMYLAKAAGKNRVCSAD